MWVLKVCLGFHSMTLIYGHIFLQNAQESNTLTLIVCSKIKRMKSIFKSGWNHVKIVANAICSIWSGCLTQWRVNQIDRVPPGPRRHALHGAANARPIPLDSEEEIQTIPGAAPWPLQAQDDDSFAAPVKVCIVCACKCCHSEKRIIGAFQVTGLSILNTQMSLKGLQKTGNNWGPCQRRCPVYTAQNGPEEPPAKWYQTFQKKFSQKKKS